MVDYQRMGNGGTRPATITLNNHSLVYFKEFLQSKDIVFLVDKRHTTRPELWEEQERRLCCKEICKDDTSLIFPSLLTNAPQKVKCINSYFVINCSTLCINFNIL